MSTEQNGAAPGVEELQADIEKQRAELADTVDALTSKLDVKGRTRARLGSAKSDAAARLDAGRARAARVTADVRSAATDDNGRPTSQALAIAAGVTVTVVVAVVLLSRNGSR